MREKQRAYVSSAKKIYSCISLRAKKVRLVILGGNKQLNEYGEVIVIARSIVYKNKEQEILACKALEMFSISSNGLPEVKTMRLDCLKGFSWYYLHNHSFGQSSFYPW